MTHDRLIAGMADEMLKFGEFQDGVRDRLRIIMQRGEAVDADEVRSVDDLWDIYGDQGVME